MNTNQIFSTLAYSVDPDYDPVSITVEFETAPKFFSTFHVLKTDVRRATCEEVDEQRKQVQQLESFGLYNAFVYVAAKNFKKMNDNDQTLQETKAVNTDSPPAAMVHSVVSQVVDFNEMVKQQAKFANEKRLILQAKKENLVQYVEELAEMQKVLCKFTLKWFSAFPTFDYNARLQSIKEEVELAQAEYEAEKTRTNLLVTQKNQSAADGYCLRKKEMEVLQKEREELDQKIALKKAGADTCCKIACEINPLTLCEVYDK